MSDTTTETDSTSTEGETTTADTTQETAADTAVVKDWEAEAAKWKSLSRKHEESAKSNADKAKRLDEFEESQKTELQKAADEATKARDEAAKTGSELARLQAAVKHGLSEEDLELLGTHGTPEEIGARAELLAARLRAADDAKPKPDFGGGDRGTDVTSKGKQLTRDDLKNMTSEQIVEAKAAGQLSTLLGT